VSLVLKPHLGLPLLASLALAWASGRAAEAPSGKAFFLPKSPAAAAYVLGRLSNQELAEAPRSEFVYVALLERQGLDRKYRVEALAGLAQARQTDPLTELIGGISRLDRKGEAAVPALRDLTTLLLQTPATGLSGKRAGLEHLANEAETPLGRQAGWAALVTADASADPAWRQAEANPAHLADLLLAIPLLKEGDLRAAFYPKLEPIVGRAGPPEVRRAAITALPAIPGHEAESFRALAALVGVDAERAVAVTGLQRIPRAQWPVEAAGPLVDGLVRYLQGLPVEQRTTSEALDAFQLATDLSAGLPAEKAAVASQALHALGVSVFVVRTIKEQMLYDRTLIVVEAGKPVQIVLINDDAMPHNLVVVAPGALEEIGQAAEKLPLAPDAQGRLYIPDSPKILHATKLVEPGQQVKLAFTAPEAPGEYQYVCTFPGHWRRMTGTLAVVKNVEAYLASHPVAPPKVTPWKLADLAPELANAGSARDLLAGRALFTQLACVQCHKLGTNGYAFGPDLTEVFKRWQGDRAQVLEQILEPSKVIEDRYRPIQLMLKDGDDVTGLILKEEGDTVTIQSGASDSLIQTLKKSLITERRPQKFSVMPVGLLNTLSKEQIFDLLAFLEAGGAVPLHEHPH